VVRLMPVPRNGLTRQFRMLVALKAAKIGARKGFVQEGLANSCVWVWRRDLKRGVESLALLQKRQELIHREQQLADVVVQRRLAQRVAGMGLPERDGVRFARGIEEHPRRAPTRLLRAVAEPVQNADETPPRKLRGKSGHHRTLGRSRCHFSCSLGMVLERHAQLCAIERFPILKVYVELCDFSLRPRSHLPRRPTLLQQPRQLPPLHTMQHRLSAAERRPSQCTAAWHPPRRCL
jgi:hypothetical protein